MATVFVTPTPQDTLDRLGKTQVTTKASGHGQVEVAVTKAVAVDAPETPSAVVLAAAETPADVPLTVEQVVYPNEEYKRISREMATGVADPQDVNGLGYDYSSGSLTETET